MNIQKQKIQKAFGDKVLAYDQQATLQQNIAQKLSELTNHQNPQSILEIGCGTGFLTKNILQKFPNSLLTAIDISAEMIDFCKSSFKTDAVSFAVADGENFEFQNQYDLIVSSMAIQWFDNPLTGLENLKKFLNPHGKIFYSVPGPQCFQEWSQTLEFLEFDSGLHTCPDYQNILYTENTALNYPSALEFLKDFKKIGAQQPRNNYQGLNPANFKKACDHFDQTYQGQITWQIIYGYLNNPE